MNDKEILKYFEKVRRDFPILKQKVNGHNLVYVDNGASSQKPKIVIDSICEFYLNYNANVHRGIHSLSEKATDKYESVREKVADLINCKSNEVVFTYGSTHGVNQVAFGLINEIKKGDEIILTEMEHHANIVPWQEVAKKTGAKLKFIPVKEDFTLDLNYLEKEISNKTKVVSVCHVSNVLGTINDVLKIGKIVREKSKAYFVIDGAQSVPHMRADVKKIDCDFFTFSAHKMCGPTGVGVLYGKYNCLEKLVPLFYGGDMIYEVKFEISTFNKIPFKLEAGTPNISGVISMGVAIDYLQKIGIDNIEKHEKILTKYFLNKINEIDDFKLFGMNNYSKRIGVFSFNLGKIHPHDMSSILDNFGIAIRGGHHCAMPLVEGKGVCAVSRISLYFYNTIDEIDFIVESLKKAAKEYELGHFLL